MSLRERSDGVGVSVLTVHVYRVSAPPVVAKPDAIDKSLALRYDSKSRRKGGHSMLFLPRDEGQGLVEYALILALVALVVIVVLITFGPVLGNVFSNIISNI